MARGLPTPDPRSREAIGHRLKALRLGLGHTQGFMASRLGSSTSGQLWENYERARRQPRYPTLQEISQRFGYSILWILDGREDQLTAEQLRTVQLGEFRIDEEESKRLKKRKKVSRPRA